jgi:hypothetical protein
MRQLRNASVDVVLTTRDTSPHCGAQIAMDTKG